MTNSDSYKRLENFITKKMVMLEIYQPVMLKTLLQQKGEASVTDIALAIAYNDKEQIKKFKKITYNPVGKVLTKNHGITEKHKNKYVLKGFSDLTQKEVTHLIALCDRELERYLSKTRVPNCPFCDIKDKRITRENEMCYAVHDKYPATPLHSLIIPKRHIDSYFELYQPEINGIQSLLREVKGDIEKADRSVGGFTIGINNGDCAGQTIHHCHIHLIPRRINDVSDPTGGVRGVIPDKQQWG